MPRIAKKTNVQAHVDRIAKRIVKQFRPERVSCSAHTPAAMPDPRAMWICLW